MEGNLDSCSGEGGTPQSSCSDVVYPLGVPLPSSPHALSVSLPRWSDVVGYEEGDPTVVGCLQSGYPRFVLHPFVAKLFRTYTGRFARTPDERAIAFVSLGAAQRCLAFLAQAGFDSARIENGDDEDQFVVLFPEAAFPFAKAFWQHTGWIVSSRRAAATAARGLTIDRKERVEVETALRCTLARFAGVESSMISLFPSGMAAIDAAHQAVCELSTQRTGEKQEGIQFGFPYLDTLKVQQKFGRGARLFARGDRDELQQLAKLVAEGRVSHVITETPCNPLLQTPPLAELSSILRPHGIPLVVDDTIGTCYNLDVKPYADIIVTSLTKFFSGAGDVAAGSLIVNSLSPLASSLLAQVEAIAPRYYLFPEDARVLLQNSADFATRMALINSNAETLAEYLRVHPQVKEVFYPKFVSSREYEMLKTPHGGYGGLLSFVLHEPAHSAPKFYDALRVSKGPGLGTAFTLACPYTLLAHYTELEWAEANGVSRYLIRVSVGVENVSSILATFDRAFKESLSL